jgi:hypothetical protein
MELNKSKSWLIAVSTFLPGQVVMQGGYYRREATSEAILEASLEADLCHVAEDGGEKREEDSSMRKSLCFLCYLLFF